MLRLWVLEYLLCVTLNLFRCLKMNETYEFKIDKNEHGEPVVTHRELGVGGGFGALDALILDPAIEIEPTQSSYDFTELLLNTVHDYLISAQMARPRTLWAIEFAEAADDDESLQVYLEAFIQTVGNEIVPKEEFVKGFLDKLFAVDGATWVIGRVDQPECNEVTILDSSRYPVVKVAEKLNTLWPSDFTTTARTESLMSERWLNFDYLETHFPLFVS